MRGKKRDAEVCFNVKESERRGPRKGAGLGKVPAVPQLTKHSSSPMSKISVNDYPTCSTISSLNLSKCIYTTFEWRLTIEMLQQNGTELDSQGSLNFLNNGHYFISFSYSNRVISEY